MAENFDSYAEAVRARLEGAGFKSEDPPPAAALQARRRRVKLTRFGLVETVVGLSSSRTGSGPEDPRAFNAGVFQAALERKVPIPRGLGSSVVVCPVLVVDEASQELRAAVSEEPPKHWGRSSFQSSPSSQAGA